MACNGLKMGSFHLFRHPKWSRIIFEKIHFWKNPFLTHFWSQSTPFSRHFGIFRRAKTGRHELKTCQKHLFCIPCSPRSFLKEVIFFFAPGGPC